MISSLSKTTSLFLIVALNLIPAYGMFFLGWTIFSILYYYWLETYIASLFQTLRIVYAGKTTGNDSEKKLKIALRYLLVRTAMFFFYLVFIVVFVGLIVEQKENIGGNLRQLFLLDSSFNLALLGLVLSYGINFTFDYLIGKEYKQYSPGELANFFDFRTIIIHIVVVLGGVGYGFFAEKGMSSRMGQYIYLLFFILLKTGYDVFTYSRINKGKSTERN